MAPSKNYQACAETNLTLWYPLIQLFSFTGTHPMTSLFGTFPLSPKTFSGNFLSDSLTSIQQIDDPKACDPIGSMKHRHDPEPLPINDQHRSRGHPYWPLYPHEWIFEWTSSCRVLFPLLLDMLQIPEVRHGGIPVDQQLVHYVSYLVTFIVLFSRSRVPASLWSNHKVSGQTMMDTVTPRGPRDISPSSEEQILILSYQVTWHTFPWTRKPP